MLYLGYACKRTFDQPLTAALTWIGCTLEAQKIGTKVRYATSISPSKSGEISATVKGMWYLAWHQSLRPGHLNWQRKGERNRSVTNGITTE